MRFSYLRRISEYFRPEFSRSSLRTGESMSFSLAVRSPVYFDDFTIPMIFSALALPFENQRVWVLDDRSSHLVL